MLSTFFKLKAPTFHTESYNRVKDLLLASNYSAFISNQAESSFPDSEFEVCLDASYDKNGLVTDLNLMPDPFLNLNRGAFISNQTTFSIHDDELNVCINASFDNNGAVTDINIMD